MQETTTGLLQPQALVNNSWQRNKVVTLLLCLAMVSTLTVPAQSNINNVLMSILGHIGLIRQQELTSFIWMYNIIGFTAACLFYVLPLNILFNGGGRIKFGSDRFSLFLLFWWAFLQTVSNIVFGNVSSSTFILPFTLFFTTLFFIQQDESYHLTFERIFTVIGLINAVVVIIQFLQMYNGGNVLDCLRLYRPPGFFPDATLSSVFMALNVTMILFRWTKEKKKLISLLLLLLAATLNGSRIFFVLISISVPLLIYCKTSPKRLGITMISCIIIILLFLLIVEIFPIDLADRVSGFLSDSSRLDRRQLAIDLFKQSPLFGNGPYAYGEAAYKIYGYGNTVHNYYASILCEFGLFGFALFLIPVIVVFVKNMYQKNLYFCMFTLLIVSGFVTGLNYSLQLQIIWYYIYGVSFYT